VTVADIASRFVYPQYEPLSNETAALEKANQNPRFKEWYENSVSGHKQRGYATVTVSLKPEGAPPGDATAEQMEKIADLAERFSFGEIRVSHVQNLVLPHVAQRDLPELWRALDVLGVATPNVNLISDIISCPGLDYCSLANARSIPIAQGLTRRFRDLEKQRDLGPIHINIDGCINSCGHHHIGNIGILGVEKNGEEVYQIKLGGRSDSKAQLGELLGPAVPAGEIIDVVENIIDVYVELRNDPHERFVNVVHRVGLEPFKERIYAAH